MVNKRERPPRHHPTEALARWWSMDEARIGGGSCAGRRENVSRWWADEWGFGMCCPGTTKLHADRGALGEDGHNGRALMRPSCLRPRLVFSCMIPSRYLGKGGRHVIVVSMFVFQRANLRFAAHMRYCVSVQALRWFIGFHRPRM